MANGIKFDIDTFRNTAEALMILNPACREQGYTADSLVALMQSFADTESKYGEKTTYVGTFGFHVTVYQLSYTTHEGYTKGAAATLAGHLALAFVKQLQKLANGRA